MRFLTVIWDDSPGGNVEHVADHGLTPEEVEDVLQDLSNPVVRSRSTNQPMVFGQRPGGRYIAVVFDPLDADTAYPVTAYEVPEP